MTQISSKLRRTKDGYSYWCQGCECIHSLHTDGPTAIWGFDGNVEAPTFTPSVLWTTGHYTPGHKEGSPCWCTYNAAHPERPSHFECGRCHTFIRAGMVQFLGDCTHAFAGQTVPLPDLPAAHRDTLA